MHCTISFCAYINNELSPRLFPLFVRFLFVILSYNFVASGSVLQRKLTNHLTEVVDLHIATVPSVYSQV